MPGNELWHVKASALFWTITARVLDHNIYRGVLTTSNVVWKVPIQPSVASGRCSGANHTCHVIMPLWSSEDGVIALWKSTHSACRRSLATPDSGGNNHGKLLPINVFNTKWANSKTWYKAASSYVLGDELCTNVEAVFGCYHMCHLMFKFTL